MNKRGKDAEKSVYKKIKQAIITKKYTSNSQLVESTLAEELKVSRTPIRSALKKLSYEGLVNIIPNKGAFVAQTTIEEYIDLYSSRELLEKESARIAAKNISLNELENLKQLLEEEKESYNERNLERFIEVNNEIHMTIAKSCRNQYFIKFIEELVTKSTIYLILYDEFHTRPLEELNSVIEHKEIYEALKNRNPDKSAEVMSLHIKSIFENLGITKIRL
ncbi:GntR family transcriptional regulator [Clostridium sediminicola]|uniref:GntR family transcriptional regulator n=1 Tax=Clostridium sediminicola TaxID=3114879 RepID=UPI0031F21D48